MDDKNNIVQGQSKDPPVMLMRAIVGIVLGGLCGFGLYRYVGCADGTCLISSSPWGSVVYCMILGFVLSQIRGPSRVT
jgi:hypothetical protein